MENGGRTLEMNEESPGDSSPSDRKWYYRLICYKGRGRSAKDTQKRVRFIIEKWLERYRASIDNEEEFKKEDGEEDKKEEDYDEENDNEVDNDEEDNVEVDNKEEISQKEGEDEMKPEEGCHKTEHLPSTSIGCPHTSARESGRRTVDFVELPPTSARYSHEIIHGQRKPLRSIIKTSESSLKSPRSTVTFGNIKEDTYLNTETGRKVISTTEEEESNENDFLEKCKRFCSKPLCKIITCITFGILLPTFLIYPGLFYLYELSSSQKKIVEEEPS